MFENVLGLQHNACSILCSRTSLERYNPRRKYPSWQRAHLLFLVWKMVVIIKFFHLSYHPPFFHYPLPSSFYSSLPLPPFFYSSHPSYLPYSLLTFLLPHSTLSSIPPFPLPPVSRSWQNNLNHLATLLVILASLLLSRVITYSWFVQLTG